MPAPSVMEFVVRCLLLLVLAIISQLPPTFNIKLDADSFLGSFYYTDSDGSARRVGPWVDGPGWRDPQSDTGNEDPSDRLSRLEDQSHHLANRRREWSEHQNRYGAHIPSALCCVEGITPLEGWKVGDPVTKITPLRFNRKWVSDENTQNLYPLSGLNLDLPTGRGLSPLPDIRSIDSELFAHYFKDLHGDVTKSSEGEYSETPGCEVNSSHSSDNGMSNGDEGALVYNLDASIFDNGSEISEGRTSGGGQLNHDLTLSGVNPRVINGESLGAESPDHDVESMQGSAGNFWGDVYDIDLLRNDDSPEMSEGETLGRVLLDRDLVQTDGGHNMFDGELPVGPQLYMLGEDSAN